MKKKLLAIFLLAAMVLTLFTGCGSTAASAQTSAAAAEAEEASEAASVNQEQAEDMSEIPVESATETENTGEALSAVEEDEAPTSAYVDIELPLVTDDTTLSMWIAMKPFLIAYNIDPYDMTFYKEMINRTGVNLDISSCAIFAATENFNLIMASGDYPDMIDSFQVFYTGSADSAIEQGIIVDMMDYMDEYMPNYRAALDSNSSFWLDSMTQDGALPSANMLFATSEGPTIGFMIREDWLADVGMDTPQTYDDMEAVLAAFKEQLGVSALALNAVGQCEGLSNGLGARAVDINDVTKAAFLNVNGEVSFSPAEDGYREYLEMLADWYAKGYIWQDFISQGSNLMNYMASGAIGICTAERDYLNTVTEMLRADDADAGFIGLKSIRKDPAEVLNISYFVENIIYGTAISATGENQELCAQWLDYPYSPEGQLLTNYGVEGEALTYDEEGNPCYTDLVINNADYGATAACAIFSMYGGGMLCYGDRTFPSYTDRVRDALEAWDYDTQDWDYPTKVTMSTEQGEEYTAIINEINGYLAETTLKFIVGELPVNDETWQEYLDTINEMGLQDAIAIKQEALDAYLSNA